MTPKFGDNRGCWFNRYGFFVGAGLEAYDMVSQGIKPVSAGAEVGFLAGIILTVYAGK